MEITESPGGQGIWLEGYRTWNNTQMTPPNCSRAALQPLLPKTGVLRARCYHSAPSESPTAFCKAPEHALEGGVHLAPNSSLFSVLNSGPVQACLTSGVQLTNQHPNTCWLGREDLLPAILGRQDSTCRKSPQNIVQIWQMYTELGPATHFTFCGHELWEGWPHSQPCSLSQLLKFHFPWW